MANYNLNLQSFWIVILKVISISLSFYLIPFSVKLIGKNNYGVWIVLSSFFSWFGFLDFGIGNSLKNRIAENDIFLNRELIKSYISTSYVFTIIVSFIVGVLMISISFFVNWWKVLFGAEIENINNFQIYFLITFLFTIFSLPLKLILSIYHGVQSNLKPSLLNLFQTLSSIALLGYLANFGTVSFQLYVILLAVTPWLVLVFSNIFEFAINLKELRPNWLNFDFKALKSLFSLSFKFLALQLSVLVLTTTDNFLIGRFFGAENVFEFGVSSKLYGFVFTLQLLILTPYWTAFTKAFARNEFDWIRKKILKLNLISIFLVLLVVVLLLTSDTIFRYWLGREVCIPISTQLVVALYNIVLVIYAPFNFFINGVGKVKLHTYGFLISAILNIPISLLLSVTFSLGPLGVVLGSIVCLVPYLFLFPYQYYYIINRKGNGLFNQ